MGKFLLLYFATHVFSALIIWSPDDLFQTELEYTIATFGNPTLFPQYAKLAFYKNDLCQIVGNFSSNTFVVGYNFLSSCLFTEIALSVQKSGASGFIFIDTQIQYGIEEIVISSVEPDVASQISITVLAISNNDGNTLLQYASNEIWISYNYDLTISDLPVVNFLISGNFTLDKIFLSALKALNSDFGLTLSNFQVSISYYSVSFQNISSSKDCIYYSDYDYCSTSSGNVFGSQKILNSIKIVNFFNSLEHKSEISNFLNFLRDLYNMCEFNYTDTCINNMLENYSAEIDSDLSALDFTYDFNSLAPLYLVNNIEVYWPSSLDYVYCLSFASTPKNCQFCSGGCSYSSLNSSECNAACNNSQCGYNNFNCLEKDGCYSFMLNDGNCNRICENDPDCSSQTDICSENCFFSELRNGLCPSTCGGTCFKYCSLEYCSPNCLYKDLESGNCSSDCTDVCMNYCNTLNCDNSCYLSYQNTGLCHDNCTSDCCQTSDGEGHGGMRIAVIVVPIVIIIL